MSLIDLVNAYATSLFADLCTLAFTRSEHREKDVNGRAAGI